MTIDELDRLDMKLLEEIKERRMYDWFADALVTFQGRLLEYTGTVPGLAVSVSEEFGLLVGMAPGATNRFMGPGGIITVKSGGESPRCGLPVSGGTCRLPQGHGGHTQDGGCER